MAGADGDALFVEQLGDVVGMGFGEREAHEAGAVVGRRAKDLEAVDFQQTVVRISAEFVFVLCDFFEADEIQVVDRCAEGDGRRDWRRTGFEFCR